MNTAGDRRRLLRGEQGYLIVLFIIVLTFVAIAAAMHVLVLTSVATSSRAYDSFRQGSIELARLQSVAAEAVLDLRQTGVAHPVETLDDALTHRLADLTVDRTTGVATVVPDTLPTIISYPDSSALPDQLTTVPPDLVPFLTPELSSLVGARVVAYPEIVFRFTTQRTVLEKSYTYTDEIRARFIAVPLTRFGLAAYELPADIGTVPTATVPSTTMPAGLVPSRDPAFVADLQAQSGVLPYHFRRRALLSAAYQYLFSQLFIDRVAEYAGIAHYCDLAASGGTAALAGLRRNGTSATWDLAQAGSGTFGSITTTSDAAVVFTQSGGYAIQFIDSAGNASTTPLFILVLGPSTPSAGALAISFASIARPIVFVGFNVRVTASPAASINGALFLDPQSTLTASTPVTVPHLSYWAGATGIDAANVAAAAMPPGAEALAPRVVYVATTATRL